jgi:uncharacterized protein YlxW (UPF0749 family)
MMDLNPAPIEETTLRTMPKQDRRKWWGTLFLLCGILGAMLGLSVRTQQVIVHKHDTDVGNIDHKQVADQQRAIKEQQDQIAKLEKAIASGSGQKTMLLDDLKSAKFLAGLTAVKGPGVIVTLSDSKNPFPGGLPANMQPPNIIHDTDINQVVNELKAAGAEAVAVNDQRLVAVSPVRCAGPTVFVNNTAQTPPYVIMAIGDPKTLETALNISGGIAAQIKQFDKAMFQITPSKQVTVPAYSGTIPSKYAVPVSGTSTSQVADRKPGA